MPPKKFDRKQVFGEKKPNVPYVSASAAQSVYENGGLSLPDEAFVDPLEKENAQLRELNAETETEKELLRQEAEHLREQLAAQSSGLLIQDGGLMVQGFQFSPTGLIAPESFSEEAWQQVGLLLNKLEGSIQWLIGDWIIYGDQVGWGDLPKLAAVLGRDYDTLRNYANVSRKVKLWLRNHNLSYNHHRVAATLSSERQADALNYALAHNLSVAEFRKWAQQQTGKHSSPASLSGFDADKSYRAMKRLSQRDPTTAKAQDYEDARRVYEEMQAAIRAFGKQWGIKD